MTEEDFFAELAKLPRKGWTTTFYQVHGTQVRVIKLQAPPWVWVGDEDDFCPLTAVCLAVRGRFFLPRDYPEAASLLELDPGLEEIVIRAADDSPRHDPATRVRLLRALGLAKAPREVA